MREPSMNNIQKDEILKKCFTYFVEHGLESISMRKMCDETGMAVSSAYYWFGNKDGAILSATEYGLNRVADILFDYVYQYIDNLEYIMITFSEFIMKYKAQLRFIYQVVTSQKYGGKIRPIANRLTEIYDRYTEIIADHFGCRKQELQPYVYLFISAVLDYVIWHDKDKMEVELACVYKAVTDLINKDKGDDDIDGGNPEG